MRETSTQSGHTAKTTFPEQPRVFRYLRNTHFCRRRSTIGRNPRSFSDVHVTHWTREAHCGSARLRLRDRMYYICFHLSPWRCNVSHNRCCDRRSLLNLPRTFIRCHACDAGHACRARNNRDCDTSEMLMNGGGRLQPYYLCWDLSNTKLKWPSCNIREWRGVAFCARIHQWVISEGLRN